MKIPNLSTFKIFGLFLAMAVVFLSHTPVKAAGGADFDPGELIMDHIADDYEWHFFTLGDFHATLYLPVMVYHSEQGFQVFSSKRFHEENPYNGYYYVHGEKLSRVDGSSFWDFSITKNVFSMLISAILMLWIFLGIAGRYKQATYSAPKGLQSLMEPIILFIQDEVVKPSIGKKYRTYLPYILSLFFFIWINNLLGLLPGAANATGNIAVTAALALIAMIVINVSATKDYWVHIFNTPGVPWWLKFPLPLMPVVEFIGVLTKPFALMVRLFANITAGHILILSVITIIFILGKLSPAGGFGFSIVSVGFGLFLYALELLVAAVQAFIFSMLTAVFIGQAVEEHEHH